MVQELVEAYQGVIASVIRLSVSEDTREPRHSVMLALGHLRDVCLSAEPSAEVTKLANWCGEMIAVLTLDARLESLQHLETN